MLMRMRIMESSDGSFENEALENEDRSTKHPNLENEAPKTRKRSTQISKTKHPKLENEALRSRNHCRLKDYNFKSCMTQAKPAGGNGCVKALQSPRKNYRSLYGSLTMFQES